MALASREYAERLVKAGSDMREEGYREGWLLNLESLPGIWSARARMHTMLGGKPVTGRTLLAREIACVEQGIRERRPELHYSKARLKRLRRQMKKLSR